MFGVEREEVVEDGDYSVNRGIELDSSNHERLACVLIEARVKGPRAGKGEPPGFWWEV